MKPVRKLLVTVAVLSGLLLVVMLLAMTAPVQTWVVRRALAARPEWQATVTRVDVGLRRVHIEGARVHHAGAVLSVPALEAEISLRAAVLHDQVVISKLVARGWTLDLTKYAGAPAVAVGREPAPLGPFSLVSTAYAASAAPPVQTVFQGVFRQLQLPVDLTLDGVSLEGEVLLPASAEQPPVQIGARLMGGGLAAGKEGSFDLTARFDVTGDATLVNALEVRGVVDAVMDTSRSFSKVTARLDSVATGPAIPEGVQLTADVSAARVPGGESYAITVQSVGKRLLDIQANYPVNSSRLGGVWRLDMRDTDVAPFALGRPLPAFEAVGAGMFETDTGFAEIHTAGRIKSAASRLEVLRPELADVGAVTVFGEFDLTQSAQTTRLDRLSLTVNRPDPVFSAESLQAFEFNPVTGELKVADPNADLLEIDVHGVPMAWSRAFLPDWTLSGGALRGRLTASARNGGLLLRSLQPLTIDGLDIGRPGRLAARALDAAVSFSADYSPRGWQADIPQFTLSSGGQTMLTMALKTGRLPGPKQPLKTTGRLSLSLPELLRQPLAQGLPQLAQGTLQLDFSSSLGAQHDLQAGMQVTGLTGPDGATLPDVASDARATIDTTGAIKFNLPLVFTHRAKQRASDLTVSGTLRPEATGYRIEGRLGGERVYIEDVQLLAGLVGGPSGDETDRPGTGAARDDLPFWHGVDGTLSIALKRLYYDDQFEVSDVAGTVHLAAGALKIDGVRAGMGEEGSVKAAADLSFNAAASQPYTLAADVAVTGFDPAPLFKAIDPARPPQVEGRFDLKTQLGAQGINVGDLLSRAKGDLQLTSKGGVFRLLSADVSSKVETAGKVAALGAFIGNVASAFGKGKDAKGFANNAQAVAELSGMLAAIKYDQLNVVLARDVALNTALQDFSLIAPEIRLEGSGQLTGLPGEDLMQQSLAMQFQMKARGHTGDALRYLHALDDQEDELGYVTCKLPLKVGGTLAAPDTREIQTALTKLAIERSGAGDLFDRLLGK